MELGQRRSDSLSDGQRRRRFEQQQAELSLGLNGYLGHPAIGDFRLGLALLLSSFEGARLADSDRLGGEVVLNFLPRSQFPSSLFFRREAWDNVTAEGVDPFSLFGIAEESNRWGGRFRMRRGLLRGTLVGFEHTDISFVSQLADEEVHDRQFVDWSRSGDRLSHHLRIERNSRDYGAVDLEIEDLAANFDQNGFLTETVRWELAAIAVLRDLLSAGQELSTEDYRLRTRVTKEVKRRDQFEVRFDAGQFDDGRFATREIQSLSALYRWRLGPEWEIAPFAAYSLRSVDGLELATPRAGVGASWRRSVDKLTAGLSGRVSFGEVERREGAQTLSDSQAAYSLSASLRHGRGNGLRKELEAEASRNEVRFGRGPVLDVPDVTLPPRGLAAEDFFRARATLGWRRDSQQVTGWLEWSRRESSDDPVLGDLEAETARGALQAGVRELSVQLETGETLVRESQFGSQEVRFATATLSAQPARRLRLRVLYRVDDRELILAPDIESARAEAGVEWRIGAVVVEATAFDRRQELVGGSETTNRGFRWTVSRRFAGWLPIVTGGGRRGVIR